MALTAKQQTFVTAYLDGGMTNAAAAYRIAYPTSKKWSAQTVANKAYHLLAHGEIGAIIDTTRKKASQAIEKSADRFAISKERISDELARLAFVDVRKLFKWDGKGVTVLDSASLTDDEAAAVVEVSHTVTKEGGTIKVKLADKQAALMNLARLHGFVVDKPGDVTVNLLVQQQADQQRSKLIAKLQALAVPEPLVIDVEVEK